MDSPRTRAQLAGELRQLGVAGGDTLFVHSSFRALGPVEGGAPAAIGALEDALGPSGLLLMPSFNLVAREKRAETWDPATTPSTVGWLTEAFRRMPGTARSDHYSHSVAARGKGAAAFVADHRSREGDRSPWDLEPWGKTYGANSPMARAYDVGGKVLMLGVTYDSATYMHVVEVRAWNRRLARDPAAEFYYLDRETLGAWWDAHGPLRRGRVGASECRLFGIREFVDGLLAEVERDPAAWFKWYPPPATAA
jgi:aminoglycoside 3-N-acetyltransferase